ncbi:MAG TPA: metal-dependent hydrolase [Gemmatimonadaceae bacterium]|nr:metal-dependent hydrolase [Gemmatimonadaceae bacterium]
MFAINHAATALIFKRRFPAVALVPLLLAVQAMEFAWVLLNYLGLEQTTTAPTVRYIGDVHLAHMPYSHSVLTAAAAAALVWAIGATLGHARIGMVLGLAILSHLILDLLTHNGDIALTPFANSPKYGTFLYGHHPLVAFSVEMAFGLACWRIFRGGKALLAVIVIFNLANLSLFVRAIPGPEDTMAGHPLRLVTVIFVQIVATLTLVGWGARRSLRTRGRAGGAIP